MVPIEMFSRCVSTAMIMLFITQFDVLMLVQIFLIL